jgi:hypothetical protein
MPKNSMADFVTDWDGLLKRVTANSTELPDLSVYSAPLAQILEAAKDGIAGSLAHRGVKQEATQTLKEVLTQGKLAAFRLRSALKAHYGPENERLVEYNMKPVRPRVRKPASQPAVESPPPASSPPTAPTNEKPKTEDPASASHSEATPNHS